MLTNEVNVSKAIKDAFDENAIGRIEEYLMRYRTEPAYKVEDLMDELVEIANNYHRFTNKLAQKESIIRRLNDELNYGE